MLQGLDYIFAMDMEHTCFSLTARRKLDNVKNFEITHYIRLLAEIRQLM
jgi:hypothetical protein